MLWILYKYEGHSTVSVQNYTVISCQYLLNQYCYFQGIVTGTGENSEFGEVFKLMKAEEVSAFININDPLCPNTHMQILQTGLYAFR